MRRSLLSKKLLVRLPSMYRMSIRLLELTCSKLSQFSEIVYEMSTSQIKQGQKMGFSQEKEICHLKASLSSFVKMDIQDILLSKSIQKSLEQGRTMLSLRSLLMQKNISRNISNKKEAQKNQFISSWFLSFISSQGIFPVFRIYLL